MAIDMSAVSAPKRKTSATSATPRKTASAPIETRSMREIRSQGLNELGQVGQGLLLITGNTADAGAVGMYWPKVAHELANLADTNDTIASAVDFLTKTGPYSALIMAVMPLALQIAANHKMMDASNLSAFGVVPPEVLEAQMKAEVMRQQAESVRAQQDAMSALAEAQNELEKAQSQGTNEAK